MTTPKHPIEYTGMRSGSRSRPDGVVYVGGVVRTNPNRTDSTDMEKLVQEERERVLAEIKTVTEDQAWMVDCEPAVEVPIEIIQVIDPFSEERITMWRCPVKKADSAGGRSWRRAAEQGIRKRLGSVLP
ncbi:MAG: hypothetical protein AMS18_00665 [Gemmatimonas sp. SG8_17]|nr:MAG: hypothetical protein AMS18_00665 [Gemmatimonas sp. SG8_17]